jgi:hypothetical protein
VSVKVIVAMVLEELTNWPTMFSDPAPEIATVSLPAIAVGIACGAETVLAEYENPETATLSVVVMPAASATLTATPVTTGTDRLTNPGVDEVFKANEIDAGFSVTDV